VERVGRTSITVAIEVWKIRGFQEREERLLVTEGSFTYVAIDDQGRKRPVDP
jgi:acyl-CoA thioesterase YciA